MNQPESASIESAESSGLGHGFDPVVFDSLIARFRQSSGLPQEKQWIWLEAAHVVGQTKLRPHWRTHAFMLGLACRNQAWGEVIGQLFRLLLVPLGHAFGRLPIGNPGRANVSAFTPFPVRADISLAIAKVRSHSTEVPMP